jgi:hypothetical protein
MQGKGQKKATPSKYRFGDFAGEDDERVASDEKVETQEEDNE